MAKERRRVKLQWTQTAVNSLKALPKEAQEGLYAKASELGNVDDPRKINKPLVGPLAGLYRIRFSRYRLLYLVDEEKLADGGVVVTVTVRFVLAGPRKAGQKKDVYELARKLVKLGLLTPKE